MSDTEFFVSTGGEHGSILGGESRTSVLNSLLGEGGEGVVSGQDRVEEGVVVVVE